jgi:hypothetical protein
VDDLHDDPTESYLVPFDEPTQGRRGVDPGSLVIGVWFIVLGLLATVLSGDTLQDLPRVVIPVTFAVTGLALLLPPRLRPRR